VRDVTTLEDVGTSGKKERNSTSSEKHEKMSDINES